MPAAGAPATAPSIAAKVLEAQVWAAHVDAVDEAVAAQVPWGVAPAIVPAAAAVQVFVPEPVIA